MATVKIHEAKTNLSKLIARVEAGEEIVIARGDKPVVKLVPAEPAAREKRVPGAMKHISPDLPDAFFFDPLPGLAEEARPYEEPPAVARITVDPAVCGGAPCIRGMRIRVSDVLGLLAAGMTREEILADYPYLETADFDAALAYAAAAASHRIIRTS